MVTDDGQGDVGPRTPVRGERAGDERRERGREAAEAQPGVAAARELGQLVLGRVQPGQHPPRVPHQRVARLGEADRAGAALHQGHVDGLLQRRDVLAHRRLAHPERERGAGEGPAPVDLGQHLQTSHVEHKH